MTRVLIVEDDPMTRKLLETFINQSESFSLIGSIASAAIAETFCLKFPVDLVLMDVCTSLGASGLDVSAQLKQRFPKLKIVIMTNQPEYDFIRRAKEAKVDSFWYKTPDESQLIKLLSRTMNGESIYPNNSPDIRLGLANSDEFSLRQLEILKELTKGDTNIQIAQTLGISPNTVRDYIQQMLEMTGFQNRTSLAVEADKSGLVIHNY